MPEGALTSFNACDAYRYICRSGLISDVTKQVTHRIFNAKNSVIELD